MDIRRLRAAAAVTMVAFVMAACPTDPDPTDGDGPTATASPSPDGASSATPSPALEPSPTTDDTAMTLQGTVATFNAPVAFGAYSDDTSNDQCLDLGAETPTEIPCTEVPGVDDCVVTLLGDGPLAVLCDVEEGTSWGVDLGYEGAYTTADGQRGEFGISCRYAFDLTDGECSTDITGELLTYPPVPIMVRGFSGLALVAPADADDDVRAGLEELAATEGLEAAVRSSFVVYETSTSAGEPDYVQLGFNAFASLDQNGAVALGALQPIGDMVIVVTP